MPLKAVKSRIKNRKLSKPFGTIIKINPTNLIATGITPSIGDIVKIESGNNNTLGMVTSIDKNSFTITPFGFLEGLKVNSRVYLDEDGMMLSVGDELIGRVVDPFMNPIDSKGAINFDTKYPIMKKPISPLARGLIDEVFPTGIKAIDGLLTCGKGQKMGIFAGSGVGKSTLMSMIVRGSKSKIKVIALIGERGREIPEFIEKNLGGDLHNTIMIVATSDDSALMRKYGAFSAMAGLSISKIREKMYYF